LVHVELCLYFTRASAPLGQHAAQRAFGQANAIFDVATLR
jgi:hypothetical protein